MTPFMEILHICSIPIGPFLFVSFLHSPTSIQASPYPLSLSPQDLMSVEENWIACKNETKFQREHYS